MDANLRDHELLQKISEKPVQSRALRYMNVKVLDGRIQQTGIRAATGRSGLAHRWRDGKATLTFMAFFDSSLARTPACLQKRIL